MDRLAALLMQVIDCYESTVMSTHSYVVHLHMDLQVIVLAEFFVFQIPADFFWGVLSTSSQIDRIRGNNAASSISYLAPLAERHDGAGCRPGSCSEKHAGIRQGTEFVSGPSGFPTLMSWCIFFF